MSNFASVADCVDKVEFTQPGVARTLYPLFTLPHLSCGTEDVQPLCEVPLHLHNEAEEVIFCYAGQGLAVVGEEQREFTPGLMVLIPRGIPHKFVNTSSSEVLKFTWTLSPPQTIQQFAAKSTN